MYYIVHVLYYPLQLNRFIYKHTRVDAIRLQTTHSQIGLCDLYYIVMEPWMYMQSDIPYMLLIVYTYNFTITRDK